MNVSNGAFIAFSQSSGLQIYKATHTGANVNTINHVGGGFNIPIRIKQGTSIITHSHSIGFKALFTDKLPPASIIFVAILSLSLIKVNN